MEKTIDFIKKHGDLFTFLGLLILCYFIFFFNIGNYALMDVDETRYVSMARDMFHSKDFLTLYLNGEYFFEKPPLYFWGECLSFAIFGKVNEFTARFPVALYGMLSTLLVYMFRKSLKASKEKMEHIANLDNTKTITDKKLMIRSMITLVLVILGFVTHDITHIPAYVFAVAGASFLLLFEKPKEIYKDVEWLTIFFFVGLFIIIGGFEANGGIGFLADKLIELTQGSLTAATMFILWGSGILSGIIDNIPYTATMAPLIAQVQHTLPYAGEGHHPLWWALSLGACLGGNLTIIGAAANVIVSETAATKGHPISFMRFMKYGAMVTFISLLLSSIYLYFKYLHT